MCFPFDLLDCSKLSWSSGRGRVLGLSLAFAILGGCDRASDEASGPLRHSGYLWQRDWSPAVVDSVSEAERRMDGLVVLGAEVVWRNKKPEVIEATVDWKKLAGTAKPVSVAFRVAPYPGPFDAGDEAAKALVSTARTVMEKAQGNGVRVAALQIDFDCAQAKLAGYRVWLGLVRAAVRPAPLLVTTLPAWLDEPEFARLIREVDGYVLQLHSVPTAQQGNGILCDTVLARKWVAKAGRLGVPFSVALPTYRCVAGYGESGNLLSVAMDGVDPVWPPGTRVVEFATDADEVAALVNEWQKKRPAVFRDVFWYRLPVATDERNWRWPTLSAVMDGRSPLRKLEVKARGENPVDFTIANHGEADEQDNPIVTVTWNDGASVTASDALPGWSVVVTNESAVFKPEAGGQLRLSPGATQSIGWLRYDRPPAFHAHVGEVAARLR